MAVIHGIQSSFAGGEFAPSLWGRVDLAKYATGTKTLKNFIVHPHGGASNRPGMRYIATSKTTGKKIRLVAFEFSSVQNYVIEFGDLYCRFYMNGGQILSGGVPYEIVTPFAEADLFNLKFSQSADVLYITHPSYAPRQLTRIAHTNWTLSLYVFDGGPFMLSNTGTTTLSINTRTKGTGRTLTASAATFDATKVGSLYRIRHNVTAQTISQAFTSATTSSTIQCGDTWRITTHGTWAATFKVQFSSDNGGTWEDLRVFSGTSDFNANTSGEVDEKGIIRINVTSYTSGTLNVDLSSDGFEQTGIVQVTGYTDTTHVTVDVLDEVGSTSTTTDWAEGSWSTGRGYPSCSTFYADRLAFASTTSEPQTIWFSETGDYGSFDRHDPLEDSDGVTISLPSGKLNAIKSMVPLKDILALTTAAEWSVGAGSDGTLSPSSITSSVNGYRGTNGVQPVVIGNRAIYIQPQGSVVRDLGYDLNSSGFAGTDLSILSNHLFTNYEIVDLAYQQEPDSLVWAVRNDGVLLSMTYLREHEVIAWTRHETNGLVESVCCIPGDTYDELWIVVKRGTARFIEKMVQRMTSTDPRDQFFVDAGISYDSPVTISGATQANPVVITATAHGFSNGDYIDIDDVVGMTQLNGLRFIIANVTANTFSLKNEDTGVAVNGTAYTAYSSGGKARKATTTITGLTHLNGYTVKILADGNVETDKVVSGGSITIGSRASRVHIGLGYTCDLETLNPELGLRDGTAQDRKVRIPKATFRFLNSRGGKAGPNSSNLNSIVQRTNERLGSPVALYTGDYEMELPTSYETGGRIFFRQDEPLPTTILAIMAQVEIGG